jgi:Bacterial dnaA protein helix-turn-helix
MQEPTTAEEVRERSRIVQRRLRQQRTVPKPALPPVAPPVVHHPDPLPVEQPKPEPAAPPPEPPPVCVHGHPIAHIVTVISRRYEISKRLLLSDRRIHDIVRPRQQGMFIARRLLGQPFPEIGRRFNKKDHSTVLNACLMTAGRAARDPMLAAEIEDIAREVARDLDREWCSESFWSAEPVPIRAHSPVRSSHQTGAPCSAPCGEPTQGGE